jgi:hypothetical protein
MAARSGSYGYAETHFAQRELLALAGYILIK